MIDSVPDELVSVGPDLSRRAGFGCAVPFELGRAQALGRHFVGAVGALISRRDERR